MKQHKRKYKPIANPHRKVHKAHGITLLVLWVVVIVVAVLATIGFSLHHKTLYFEKNGITLRIDKVKYDDVGSYPFTAPPGWKFVIVHATVSNTTEDTFNFAPVIQTYLKDNKNYKYYMSPATLDDPLSAGPMAARGSFTGSLSYLVPIDSSDLTFQFDF